MEKDFTILIYEKDKILNSILIEQLSYFPKYKTCLIVDQINLFKIIHEKSFDACILNLDELEEDAINFIKIFQDINKHKNIILYHNNKLENSTALENNIILLNKPFKLKQLFNYIKDIEKNEEKNETKIHLMKNLVFLPFQKIIENKKTNTIQHLTEKESNLLKFIYQNKNSEISKKNILTTIWGINQNVDTHTLETHLYRLKQKLYKIEPKLTFSLINQNGIYVFNSNY
jgi:DNA-binding response OmpR family regulator